MLFRSVYVCFDEKKGIYATTYLNDFLQDDASEFKQGDKVSLIVANQTELGFKVIVNHQYWGLLYANEVFQPLYKGQTLDGYVKKIREDQRLDLSLQPLGFAKGSLFTIAAFTINKNTKIPAVTSRIEKTSTCTTIGCPLDRIIYSPFA